MKKTIVALSLLLSFSLPALADEAIFESVDNLEEIELIVPSDSIPVVSDVSSLVKTEANPIQDKSYKTAITSLDDASAELREQLVSYNADLSAAKIRSEQIKEEIKAINKQIGKLESRLKNIEKSKKYINSNIDAETL